MPVRLLGVQIANGFSPEARIFARLLSYTAPTALEPHLLYHRWGGDVESGDQFSQAAGGALETDGLDFGWRSVARGRALPAKARARLRFLATLPRALALTRRINPDVLYSSQQLWDCQAATYLARKLDKPQVIHLHYIIGPWLHRPVLERLLTCDHVIAVSEFIRGEALRHGVAPHKVTTILNPMPAPAAPEPGARERVRDELGLAPDVPLLGIVARLDPDKGQADLLHAFSQVVKEHPRLRLLVVGEETPWHPGYGDALKALTVDLGLTRHVLFLGRRADVPRLLTALDIFVHPTRSDPCPVAPLEASSAGLPVVAYAEGSADELVQDGVTGLLAPPGDTDALAQCLLALLRDPERARALGRAGRARVAHEFQPGPAGEAFAGLLGRFHGSASEREAGEAGRVGRR